MDIGTAKLPPAERRGIPHHQLDVLDVTQEASVAAYQRAARADLDGDPGARAPSRRWSVAPGSTCGPRWTCSRSRRPTREVRARLEARPTRVGAAALHARLRRRSIPLPPHAIVPGNARRIVRALEVIELTGRPFSATMPTRDLPSGRPWARACGSPRHVLDERIAARVRADVGATGCSTRCAAWRPLGPARGPHRLAGASATRRRSAELDGTLTTEARRRRRPPR